MNNNIFIPKRINVGFQERSDTYTKKLAYVIYYDQHNKLRKEASWNSWRDDKIEPIEYENVPTSGFVLNKKVGDYVSDWNHRQAYVRVYDPRDFEFEITIENLLYILENASSIKGKGLEGEFTYGWDGKDLILIPIDSPDYKELSQFNEVLQSNNYIKAKDLIIGATYKTAQNTDVIYIGRFDCYEGGYKACDGTTFSSYRKFSNYVDDKKLKEDTYKYINDCNTGLQFFFAKVDDKDVHFEHMKSISKKLISAVDLNCVSNYADLFDKLECNTNYSPIDDSKDVYVNYTFNEFDTYVKDYDWSRYVYVKYSDRYYRYQIYKSRDNTGLYIAKPYDDDDNIKNKCRTETKQSSFYWSTRTYEEPIPTTLDEIFNILQPAHKDKYLKNGKFYKREY